VQSFGASCLRPGQRNALLYSQRLLHPVTGEPVGVVCLCFAFEDELQAIFHARSAHDGRTLAGRTLALLVDGAQQVLASSDPAWIAPGQTVPQNLTGAPRLCNHAGRTYLVQTRPCAG